MEFAKLCGDGKAVLAALEVSNQFFSFSTVPTSCLAKPATISTTPLSAPNGVDNRVRDVSTTMLANSASSDSDSDYGTGSDVESDEDYYYSDNSNDPDCEDDPNYKDNTLLQPALASPTKRKQHFEIGRHLIDNGMNDSDPVISPAIGMVFKGIEEAFALWKLYGLRTGFGVQKRGSHKLAGDPFRSTFICSRGRKPRCRQKKKKLQNTIAPQPERPYQTRRRGIHSTNCQARLIIIDPMFQNNWKVDHINLEHNHEMKPRSARFFRCHRQLPDFVKKQLQINDLAGIPQKHSFRSIVAQTGGFEKCTYISRDFYNYIKALREKNMGAGDASSLISYFEKRKVKNPEFFYECEFDDADRLKRVFWADARCRTAYRYFGDVVSFDTTYLTNKYGMPFSPFVGVNQHGQTVFLGCALLNDETIETYAWLLRTWLTCMDGRSPRGIITDQCAAMTAAIKESLPETLHRFCLWHIMKKLPTKIGQAQSLQHILPWAKQLVYNSLSEEEFDAGWLSLINEYPETDRRREWFALMFDIRHKWVPIFLNKYFWAGMSTTQRSESINSFLDGFVTGGTAVHVFAWQFAQATRTRLQSEQQEDFRSFNESPMLVSNHPFEHQVSRLYTTSMLYVFQAEVKQLININSTLLKTDRNLSHYSVSELCPSYYSDDGSETIRPGRMHSRIVIVDTRSGEYECPCNLFLFKGIVCRHALSVYSQIGRTYIPGEYVLSRWCTDQARTDELDALVPNLDDVDYVGAQQLYTTSHTQLLAILQLCGTNPELGDEVTFALDRLKDQISAKLLSSDSVSEDPASNPHVERAIKDPKHAKPVGRPRTLRLKPSYDPSVYKKANTSKRRIGNTACFAPAINNQGSSSRHLSPFEINGDPVSTTSSRPIDGYNSDAGPLPRARNTLDNSHTSLLLSFHHDASDDFLQ